MRRNPFMIVLVAVWIGSLLALSVKAVKLHEQRSACVASYSTSVCTGFDRSTDGTFTNEAAAIQNAAAAERRAEGIG